MLPDFNLISTVCLFWSVSCHVFTIILKKMNKNEMVPYKKKSLKIFEMSLVLKNENI
jgi:hypothetical protein